MTLLAALVIGILFGAGAHLLLQRDLVRIAAGMILISNAANLFIMSAGLFLGVPPIYPIPPDETISDPLVQALVLTAIVISFGVTALLLALIYRIYAELRSVDQQDLRRIEERDEVALDQERG